MSSINQQSNFRRIPGVHIIYWVIFIAGLMAAIFLNRITPDLVESAYNEANFDLLNFLSRTTSQHSFQYYLGRIEDVFVGPLTNVIYHVLLSSFVLLFFPAIRLRKFILIIFIFLCVSKWEVLFFPPYGDAVGGPFAEGIWLSRNNFDYVGLFHHPSYQDGGARVYFFSLYPTYLAILYKLIPSVKVFLLVNHLLVFVMAASVVGCVRSMLNNFICSINGGDAYINNNQHVATLTSLIILALPIFQSQAEAINMEMPSTFLGVLSVYFLTQRSFGRATFWGIVAAFVKGTAITICGAVTIICLLWFFLGVKGHRQKRVLVYAGLSVIGALFQVFSKFILKDQHASAGLISFMAGWPSLKIMYVGQIYLVSLFVFIGVELFYKRSDGFPCGKRIQLFQKYYIPVIIFVTAAMWYLLFFNFLAVSPRYKLLLAPFLVMCVVMAVSRVIRINKFMSVLLFIAFILTSYGSYGAYHFPLTINYHVLSERSLQYRNNVKLDMAMADFLQEKYRQMVIGAPFIMAQMLSLPELGYVKTPLNVMAYGMPIKYGNIKNFQGLKKEDIMNTIWVGVAAQEITRGNYSYPIHSNDKIIKEFVLGDNRATLFMGGLAIEQKRQVIESLRK